MTRRRLCPSVFDYAALAAWVVLFFFTDHVSAIPTGNYSCAIGIVGAGPGGVFSAARLAESYTSVAPSDICVFERSGRVGGRIASVGGLGPYGDHIVDAGAYRFHVNNPSYAINDWLVKTKYGLPSEQYGSDAGLHVIVDQDGKHAGLDTFVKKMTQQATMDGVRIFYDHHVESIQQSTASGQKFLTMKVGSGSGELAATATISHELILNLPMRPLLTLMRSSELPAASDWERTWRKLLACHTTFATKLYLCYPRAWWIADLGKEVGTFSGTSPSKTAPYISGRYHDGPAVCPDGGSSGRCDGCLLALYSPLQYDDATAIYYRQFQADRNEPVTIITNETVDGTIFLSDAHDAVMSISAHSSVASTTDPPPQAVLATWNMASPGFGAGMHGWSAGSRPSGAEKALEQFGIFVTNEAWNHATSSGRWAEGALQGAESFLKSHFGLNDFDDSSLPTCSNGVLDPGLGETSVDCGGGVCPPCPPGTTTSPTKTPTTQSPTTPPTTPPPATSSPTNSPVTLAPTGAPSTSAPTNSVDCSQFTGGGSCKGAYGGNTCQWRGGTGCEPVN
jgi:hypothetical protein